MNSVVFTRIHTANRGVTSYKAEGFPGVVQLAKAAFNGVHPETIEIVGVPDPVAPARKPKMTKEERAEARKAEAARLKAMSPAERATEKARKAEEKYLEAQKKAQALIAAGGNE